MMILMSLCSSCICKVLIAKFDSASQFHGSSTLESISCYLIGLYFVYHPIQGNISSIDIEVIRTVFILFFLFMKDILKAKKKHTNKKHLSNIQPNIFISKKASK